MIFGYDKIEGEVLKLINAYRKYPDKPSNLEFRLNQVVDAVEREGHEIRLLSETGHPQLYGFMVRMERADVVKVIILKEGNHGKRYA